MKIRCSTVHNNVSRVNYKNPGIDMLYIQDTCPGTAREVAVLLSAANISSLHILPVVNSNLSLAI